MTIKELTKEAESEATAPSLATGGATIADRFKLDLTDPSARKAAVGKGTTCAVIAGLLALAVSSAHAAVSSDSYVRRNLVGLWDGIDNAGRGAHDNAATVWKDLSGNGFDGAVASGEIQWISNGWISVNAKNPIRLPNGLSAKTVSKRLSVDSCLSLADPYVRCTLFGQYVDGQIDGLNIEMNQYKVSNARVRFYVGAQKCFSDFQLASNECATIVTSCNADDKWYSFAKNGVWESRRTFSAFGTFSNDCSTVLGGDSVRTQFGIDGTYHACRVYCPELGEDELSVNAAIDAIRYRGADYRLIALPTGWRFDGNGDIFFDATASAAPGGKIRLGSDAAASRVTFSAAVNGEARATLTAVPDDGVTFAGWTGDTWAIAEGTAADATIAVCANRAAVLVATFAGRVHASEGLYVTNGLVARFDGVDNAASGVHDSASGVWKDLTGNGNDGVVDTAIVSWTENGWTNAGDGFPVKTTLALGNVLKTHCFTAEMTCAPLATSLESRFTFFGNYKTSGSRGFGFEWLLNPKGLRLYYGGNPDIKTAYTNLTETASLSVASTAASQIVYQNGESVYSAANEITYEYADNALTIGNEAEGGRAKMAFHGTFHSFRLYDRQLTAAEVAMNAWSDRLRYLSGASATGWLGVGGTDWTAAENWTAGVPLSGSAVLMTRPVAAASVAISAGSAAADSLVVSNGVGETVLTLAAGTTLSVRSATLAKGARLVIGEGAVFSCSEAMTVDGAAIEFLGERTGRLLVGGTLTIGADATLSVASSGVGQPRVIPLVACGARTGEFAAFAIPQDSSIGWVARAGLDVLSYRPSRGHVVILR